MTAADPGLVDRLESRLARPILMVTLAPEIEGALALVKALATAGRIVALGHTRGGFRPGCSRRARRARRSRPISATACRRQLHKLVNPIFAQLAEDRLWASFIADGIHLHPKALRSLLRAKGLRSLHSRHRCGLGGGVAAGRLSLRRHERRAARAMARCVSPARPTSPAPRFASTRPSAISSPGGWPQPSRPSPWRPIIRSPRCSPPCAPRGMTLDRGEIDWSDDLAVTRRPPRRHRAPLRSAASCTLQRRAEPNNA